MQIKNKLGKYLLNSKMIAVLKWAILLLSLAFIFSRFNKQPFGLKDIEYPPSFGAILSLVLGLMVINWLLEIVRWRLSVRNIKTISSRDAAEAVLGGLALNWVFPFTSGDLLARLARIQDKYQATAAAMLNRGIMLIITLLLGFYGLNHMARTYELHGLFFLGLLFLVPVLKRYFKKHTERLQTYFQTLERKVLIQIVVLSVLRYAVFVYQFYLLLHMFLPEIPAQVLIAGIGWIFLVRTSLPMLLGGVGVREASGLFFFQAYTQPELSIMVPIFLIWVINTLIPSLVGFYFVWKFRLKLAK